MKRVRNTYLFLNHVDHPTHATEDVTYSFRNFIGRWKRSRINDARESPIQPLIGCPVCARQDVQYSTSSNI
eukprot:89515-Pyramimonas_sp.AAC.2